MNGAGDEEVFETEASPPAVAGPSLSPLPPDHRPAAAGNAKQATADAPGPGNLVLDLLTGTANLHESLAVLAPSLAQAMVTAAGTGLDCGVVLVREDGAAIVAGTSSEVVRLLEWEHDAAEGPAREVMAGGYPVAVLQRHEDLRWPRYLERLRAARLGSALAVRLVLDQQSQTGSSRAALVFFAKAAQAFPVQLISDARTLAGLAAKSLQLAIELHTAKSAASNLRHALDSRTPISVACGVIMAQNRCSYQEAFSILAKASSHRNIKVRRVAEDLLNALPEGSPRAHFNQ